MLVRLMEIQIWGPPAPERGGLRKGTMALVSISVWEKVRQLSCSPYGPGTFGAAAQALEFSVSGVSPAARKYGLEPF